MRIFRLLAISVIALSFDGILSKSTITSLSNQKASLSQMKFKMQPLLHADTRNEFNSLPFYIQFDRISKGFVRNAYQLKSSDDWKNFRNAHFTGEKVTKIILKEPSSTNDVKSIIGTALGNGKFFKALAALIFPLNINTNTLRDLFDNLLRQIAANAAFTHDQTAILYLQGLISSAETIDAFTSSLQRILQAYESQGRVPVAIASIRASYMMNLNRPDEDRLQPLFNLIKISPTLKALDLANLDFGVIGYRELYFLLHHRPHDNAFHHSLEYVALRNISLQIVQISNQIVDNPILSWLREARQLSLLHLGHSDIGDEGASVISEAIASNRRISLKGLVCVACSMKFGLNAFVLPLIHSLQKLSLRENEFKKASIDAFVSAVAELQTSEGIPLRSFDISQSNMNHLLFDSISILQNLDYFPHLEKLDLRRGYLDDSVFRRVYAAMIVVQRRQRGWLRIRLPAAPSAFYDPSSSEYRDSFAELAREARIDFVFESMNNNQIR